MAAHAKLSASGSKRWLSCSASVQAESGLKDSSSIYADEGTAAHSLAERCLTYNKPAVFFLGESITGGSNVFTVDEDMASAVQVYVDYCNNLPATIRLLEKRVNFNRWVPDGFGTSDFIAIEKDIKNKRQVIHVVDLKYGKGVMVDALNNSQAMLYGLGVIQTLGFIYGFDQNDLVNCTIVQPRLDHISEFSITVGDLLRWADKVVVPAVADALGDSPTYTPGDEQCRWCKAKPTCKALADENLKTVFQDFGIIPTEDLKETHEKTELTLEEVGVILKKLQMMYDWGKSVEAYAFDQINHGEHIPGYKLVQGKKGNRKWISDDATQSELIDLGLEKDEILVSKIKTPPVIEKLLKAMKIDSSWIKKLWDQPEGKPTIAPESDKRKSIKTAVNQDFSVIK